MSHLKRAREVFDVELAAVKAVRSQLTKSFDEAVRLIVAALAKRQKIVVLGVGKSGNIGRKIAATFTSTGSPAVLLDTVDAMHGDLGILNDGDILLALSYSGETDELINLLPAIRRFAVQIVAVTSRAAFHPWPTRGSRAQRQGAQGSLPVQHGARPPAPPPRSSWATRSPWPCSRRAASRNQNLPSATPAEPSVGRYCSRCLTSCAATLATQ